MFDNVFIAIGSNAGDRVSEIQTAIRYMQNAGLKLISTGFLYQTAPMYYEDQPAFLNTCVQISTHLLPSDLLRTLKRIEFEMGRLVTIRNGPRCIDLDIVFFGDQVVQTDDLVIPHPRMAERFFVLRPLEDIEPGFIHPVLKKSISEISIDLASHVKDTCVRVFPAIRTESGGLFPISGRSYIVGILNLTPDSFSDGGKFQTSESVMVHAKKLISEGADVVDVGGESTRPHASPVEASEEQSRVLEAVKNLRSAYPTLPISIDTYKASTAEAAINAGASIVNDVSGGLIDPEMLATVAKLQVPYICSQSGRVGSHVIGPILDESATSKEIISTVVRELISRVHACTRAGIYKWNVMLDPGLGFGKSGNVNFEIVRNLPTIFAGAIAGFPVMIGASRKRFVRDLTGNGSTWSGSDMDALLGTAAVTTAAVASGVAQFHRVHDVGELKKVIDVSDRIYRE